MANPHKGEVAFEADGKTYTLRYSIDALCELEAAVGKGFPVIASEFSDPDKMSIRLARAILWAGLLEHHKMTQREAGEVMAGAGGLLKVNPIIDRAIAAAFPEMAAEKTADPPTPGQESTGSAN